HKVWRALFIPREGRARRSAKGIVVLGKMLSFIGATIGGSVGWWAGSGVGFMTSFFISMIGTGIGIYVGKRLADHYDI
ncbi:MAG: hypothetical protein M3Z05_15155, partial [Gemmatimonadota bacterium]|nr:hypothetical protein [Gemmatimonadota bacterium]